MAASGPAQHVAFRSLPPGVKIGATLEPQAFGTEIHMYVKGMRSGTLCRVFLRGPGGAVVSAGTFRYRWGGDEDAVLASALDLSRARSLVVHAGPRVFVAPIERRRDRPRPQPQPGGLNVKKTFSAVAVLAVAAALVVAGCGSSSSDSSSSGGAYGSSSATTTSTSTSAGAATVAVGSASGVGQVLVDSNGMTLYYFKKDAQGNGKSTCYGSCASIWPPQATSGVPKASDGAEASKLGVIKRTDGTKQVTYNGWPLYTYTADTQPGQANGTDVKSFGASWYPLHPNGEKAGELGEAPYRLALTAGAGRGNECANLRQEPRGDLPRLLVGPGLAAGGLEEADADPRTAGEAREAGRPLDRDADESRLGDLEREASHSAARPQHLAL